MGKVIDLVGNKYGALEVIARAPKPENAKSTSAFWLCRCDCGNKKVISGNVLKQGKTRSCGCLTSRLLTESHSEDLTGRRFGSLQVISRADRPEGLSSSGAYWLCKCDCGNNKVIMGKSLRTGKTVSCGCHLQDVIDITGKKYGKLTVISQDHTRRQESNGTYWICQCECGNIISVQKSNLFGGNVQSCGCLVSNGENQIEQCLNKEGVAYAKQFTFPDLRGNNGGMLRFDFAVFDPIDQTLMCLIEYQGEQHYTNQSKFFDNSVIEHDKKKREYCLEKEIKLFCIPYWEKNITLDTIYNPIYLVSAGGDEEK